MRKTKIALPLKIQKLSLYLLLVVLAGYLLNACSKVESKKEQQELTTSGMKLRSDKNLEKPLSSISEAVKESATAMTTTAVYGCGSSMSGSSYTSGYQTYPSYAIDLSSTPQGSTINVSVNSYDVPNRFTIKDGSSSSVVGTNWMGYTTYSGPWGPSLNTPQSQTLTFTRGASGNYTLVVETVVNGTSDSWNASVTCTIPATITVNYAGVNITYETAGKIMKFNNATDLNTVLDQLDLDYENYNTNYENRYPTLTAAQLDSVDAQTGFDEFRSYKNFENSFSGFISKRSQVESKENTWLANNLTGEDPDSLDYTFDESENAVFNSNYQLKIGSTTYQMTDNGLVDISSTATLMGIQGTGCFTNRRAKQDFPTNDRKFRLKVAIHSTLIRTSVKGKVVSLKQKSGGGYKRSRMDLAVSIAGNLYDANCSLTTAVSLSKPTSGYKRRKQLKIFKREWGITYRTMSGQLGSRFDTPVGYGSVVLP